MYFEESAKIMCRKIEIVLDNHARAYVAQVFDFLKKKFYYKKKEEKEMFEERMKNSVHVKKILPGGLKDSLIKTNARNTLEEIKEENIFKMKDISDNLVFEPTDDNKRMEGSTVFEKNELNLKIKNISSIKPQNTKKYFLHFMKPQIEAVGGEVTNSGSQNNLGTITSGTKAQRNNFLNIPTITSETSQEMKRVGAKKSGNKPVTKQKTNLISMITEDDSFDDNPGAFDITSKNILETEEVDINESIEKSKSRKTNKKPGKDENVDLNTKIFRGIGGNFKKKTKLLRIGDVVLLRFHYKVIDSNLFYKSILCPERVVSKQILCYPISSMDDFENGRSIFKRALFRIENPQSYLYQNQLEAAKKAAQKEMRNEKNKSLVNLYKENYENYKNYSALTSIEELQKLANEERKGNENEFQLNYSNEVTYGQLIQFRNLFTNELLTVDLNSISEEIGCLDVSLNSLGGQIAWFKLLPADKIRNEGDCVSYSDNFFVMPVCVDSESYLHVNFDQNIQESTVLKTNISSRRTIFKTSLFESAEDGRKGNFKNVVKSTDAMKLFNNDIGGHLTVTNNKIRYYLPALYNENKDENIHMMVNKKNTIFGRGNYFHSSSNLSVFVETEEDRKEESNMIWEIQYFKPFEGKALTYGTLIRLRHISSGMYLSYKENSSELFLSRSSDESETLFVIYSDNPDENIKKTHVYYDSQINLMAYQLNMFVKVDYNKQNGSEFYLTLSRDKMDYSYMVFKIENVSNVYTKITYNIALAKDHLIHLFKRINQWAIREKDDAQMYPRDNLNTSANNSLLYNLNENKGFVYDYYLAIENESALEGDISTFIKILSSIKEETLESKPESVRYRKLQNYYSEQGFINLLLRFISLFDSKVNSYSPGGQVVLPSHLKKATQLHKKLNNHTFIKYNVNMENIIFQNEEKEDIKIKAKAEEYEDKEEFTPEGHKNKKRINLNSAQEIAGKYVDTPINISYEIINILIKDNFKSCKSIYQELEELNNQFEVHKIEIMMILKNCFEAGIYSEGHSRGSNNNLNQYIEDVNVKDSLTPQAKKKPKANKYTSSNNLQKNQRRLSELGLKSRNNNAFVGEANKYSENSLSAKYTKIDFWRDRLKIIDEREDNLEEQTLSIQLITMLCIDQDGEGIFLNQFEVKEKLFKGDSSPLKFGIKDMKPGKRPYVVFHLPQKRLTAEQFFERNPTLYALFTEKRNNYIVEPFFYMDKFSDRINEYNLNYVNNLLNENFDLGANNMTNTNVQEAVNPKLLHPPQIDLDIITKIIDYICAVLDLYYTACLNRNDENNYIVSDEKHCGLTFDHLWYTITNTNVSMKIRVRYIKLLRVLYIDVDPFVRISKNRLRCFFWEDLGKEADAIKTIYRWYDITFSTHDHFMENEINTHKRYLEFIMNYVMNFWHESNPIEREENFDSIEDLKNDKDAFKNLLEYINEIFFLTKEMIDFGFFSKKQIYLIMTGVANFFSIFQKYKPKEGSDYKTGDILHETDNSDAYRNYKNKGKGSSNSFTHWLSQIAVECLESEFDELKAILFKLYESCIEILNLICMIKEDLQLYYFIYNFKNWYEDGNSLTDNPDFLLIYEQIIQELYVFKFELGTHLLEEEGEEDNDVNIAKEVNETNTQAPMITLKKKKTMKKDSENQAESKQSKFNSNIWNKFKFMSGNKRSRFSGMEILQDEEAFNGADAKSGVAWNNVNNNGLSLNSVSKNRKKKGKIKNEKNEVIPLDMYLLGVLFTDYDNEFSDQSLDNKSLKLLIQYFNEFQILKDELAKVELIINDGDKEIFQHLCRIKKNLKTFNTNLINSYTEYFIYNKPIFSSGNILEDIIRVVDSDLIGKINLKAIKKIPKIQNFIRNLKIHENLIEMMNFVTSNSKTPDFGSTVYKFLYHFAFKNYHNQTLLKKHFDEFLMHLGEYKYVSDVLSEILNLYKETPKSKKYIEKLFFKIEQDDEMSIEIIDVLKSLCITYNEENIGINQEIIMKSFLYHQEYLKFYFSEGEKRVLDELINQIKFNINNPTTNVTGEKHFLKVRTHIKFIELLSTCSRGNTFSVLNCRKLVKVEDITRFLESNDVPYMMKPAYLEFFFIVFYVDLGKNCQPIPINHAMELIQHLILPEITNFSLYTLYFIEIYNQKNSENVKKSDKEYLKLINEVNDFNKEKIYRDEDLKKLLFNDRIDIEKLDGYPMFSRKKFIEGNCKKEYWRFLLNYQSNNYLNKQGVLVFLYSLLNYVKERGIQIEDKPLDLLMKAKDILRDMLHTLNYVEEKLGENDEVTELQYAIQRILSVYPKKKYVDVLKKMMIKNVNKKGKIPLLFKINIEKDDKGNNRGSSPDMPRVNQNNLLLNNHSGEDEEINTARRKKIEINSNKVLNLIKEYLAVNQTNISGIFSLLDTDHDKLITKFEFKRNLKFLLNNKVTNEEIEDAFILMDENNDEKISLRELTNKLIQHTKNKRRKAIRGVDKDEIKFYTDLNSQQDDKSYKIKNIFRHFIVAFHETQEKLAQNTEISELVSKLNNFLDKSTQETENVGESLKKFIHQLSHSFHKKKYKIYLLRIMSELINSKISFVEEMADSRVTDKEKYGLIKKIQTRLNEGGITQIAMNLIEKNNSPDVIEEALNLMILMLKNGNVRVQKTVLEYLSNPIYTFNFFSYVRETLHSTILFLKDKLMIKEYETGDFSKKQNTFYAELNHHQNKKINLANVDIFYNDILGVNLEKELRKDDPKKHFRIPKKILLLLQLFCENCYEPFQNFLREQDYYAEDKDKVSSINIVYEVGNFLINLLSFGQSIYTDSETLKLINQSFLTLADFCLGPCKENQILLGTRRTLYKMINRLLRNDYNFNIKEQVHRKKNMLLCQTIFFLKTLINRENLNEIGKFILEELEIFLLIEKLVDIYQLKIRDNINSLYAGKVCTHISKLAKIIKLSNLSGNVRNTFNYNQCNKMNCSKSKDHISESDLKYINTGFDIFIILTYLKDVFPDSDKLWLFKLKIDTSSYYNYLRNDMKNQKDKNDKLKLKTLDKTSTSFTRLKSMKSNKSLTSHNSKSNYTARSKDGFSEFSADNATTTQSAPSIWFKIFCFWLLCCRKKVSLTNNYSGLSLGYNDETKSRINIKKNFRKNILKRVDNIEYILKNRFFGKYSTFFTETYMFFAQNISNVEINYRNNLVKTYFKIPFIFKYFTESNKKEVIWKTKYTNHQARLEEFFLKVNSIKTNLMHQQQLGSYRYITTQWKFITNISFFLVMAINNILLFFGKFGDDVNCADNGSGVVYCTLTAITSSAEIQYTYPSLKQVIVTLQVLQITLNVLALIFLIINQYPVIHAKMKNKAKELRFLNNERKIKKYSGSILFFILYKLLFVEKLQNDKANHFISDIYKTKFLNLIFDRRVQVFTLYLAISAIGISVNPLVNAILLLDLIRRLKYLNKILGAVMKNYKQIVSTLILFMVIIYIYSILSFFYFRKYFLSTDFTQSEVSSNTYCDTLFSCFLTILKDGIIFYNGLSVMAEIPRSNPDYWLKYAMEITFFFILALFIINIIFSIIIDSFGELRDTTKSKLKVIQDYCFVCGLPKFQFEIKGRGAWISHFKYEHNIFAYLYYIIELEAKDPNDCDGLEKYVKNCIDEKNYQFLPINQALSLIDEKKAIMNEIEIE